MKNPTTFDVSGLVFGFSQTAAETNFKRGIKLLTKAFELCHQLPAQTFSTEQEMLAFLDQQRRLKIDVTEIGVQRPKNNEAQKAHYRGKKKTYKESAGGEK
ncbi:MAG: transposase family protein [Bacteroidia bacterium]|nr:transposase family protein [Bacteroidia bacterium]